MEVRAHLAIQPGERVGLDGMLFQTSGLRFLQEGPKGTPRLAPRRFALSLWSQGATVAGRDLDLAAQLAPLGGERRLARWSRASREWPQLPPDVLETIVETGRARLILLTPAVELTPQIFCCCAHWTSSLIDARVSGTAFIFWMRDRPDMTSIPAIAAQTTPTMANASASFP